MDYIWSDLHLRHENIIKYCNRPFETIEQMDKTILDNWKKTIKNNDRLFNLGDVIFGDKETAKRIIENLPGRKILIMGNHDRKHSINWFKDIGFEEVYPYPIIFNEWFILSHEYVFLNENMPYINLHGHIHDKNLNQKCYINVSVEQTNYKPIRLDEIMKVNK